MRLETELKSVSNDQMLSELRVGSLEGMADFALRLVQLFFDKIKVKKVFIDIYDLSELESHFLSGDLDLIFSFKSPGRQKYKHFLEIGYQRLDKVDSNPHIGVYSTFEFNKLNDKEKSLFSHVLVSNSLMLRKEWLNRVGGTGLLPSEAKRGKLKDQEPVYLIGSELLNPGVWKEITDISEKL